MCDSLTHRVCFAEDSKTEDDSDTNETAVPSHQQSKPFRCRVCNKQFKYKGSLHIHQTSHGEKRTYQCSTCSKRFTTDGRLLRHQSMHAEEQQRLTSIDENGLASRKRMSEDSEVVKAELKCVECGRCYQSGSALKVHVRCHARDQPQVACSVCDKRFTRLAHLERHSVIHTGLKPHKCVICGKAFGRAEHLQIHVKSHTGEKAYKCGVCKKRFTTSSSLTTHRRSHSGEKPYKCNVCDKSFGRYDTLRNHKVIHSVDRPFECTVCNKRFKRFSVLSWHSKIHTGVKEFHCSLCGKDFRHPAVLKKHISRMHDEETAASWKLAGTTSLLLLSVLCITAVSRRAGSWPVRLVYCY